MIWIVKLVIWLLSVVLRIKFEPKLEIKMSYNFSDIPAELGFDESKIQGEILPAFGGLPEGSDPNTWIMDIGSFSRTGNTNGYVTSLTAIDPMVSTSLRLNTDPISKLSTTWVLNSWVLPGPNYLVIDATGFMQRTMTKPVKRYTICVYGVMPDTALPVLE